MKSCIRVFVISSHMNRQGKMYRCAAPHISTYSYQSEIFYWWQKCYHRSTGVILSVTRGVCVFACIRLMLLHFYARWPCDCYAYSVPFPSMNLFSITTFLFIIFLFQPLVFCLFWRDSPSPCIYSFSSRFFYKVIHSPSATTKFTRSLPPTLTPQNYML